MSIAIRYYLMAAHPGGLASEAAEEVEAVFATRDKAKPSPLV